MYVLLKERICSKRIKFFSLTGPCSQRSKLFRVVRWCWVNFQCRGVLQLSTVGQGPTALAVGAGGGCLDIFTLIYPFYISPSLWETARYRLKYCLKGPLNPKQPTNQSFVSIRPLFRKETKMKLTEFFLLTIYNFISS